MPPAQYGIDHTAVVSPDEHDLSDPFLLLSDDRIDGRQGTRVGAALRVLDSVTFNIVASVCRRFSALSSFES